MLGRRSRDRRFQQSPGTPSSRSGRSSAAASTTPPSSSSSSPLITMTTGDPNHRSYVWVRTDIVEAILNNNGILPKGWKSSKKRGRDSTSSWGWMRAFVVSSSSSSTSTNTNTATTTPSSSSSPSSERIIGRSSFRSPRTKNVEPVVDRTISVTLTIDDSEFAPFHLNGKNVSLSYDSNNIETVCNANTWWMENNNNDNPDPPEDLTSLTHLHEPAVVYCLQKHYERDSIYTYTGKILIALNPFQMLNNVYGEDVMKDYWQDGNINTNTKTLDLERRPPPHVYAIAQDAYRSLLHEGNNQSILVSGESGSGKTVTTKYIMGYLANQSQRNTSNNDNQNNKEEGIESQILQSNPILESFGNARTIRNDNSSRFGKFMELLFSPGTGQLISASIETYLLEKVRLISQAPGERNYHIFYELLAGLSQQERKELLIENYVPNDFRMTGCSGTFDRRDGVDDKETFHDLRTAFLSVGFSESQQKDLFSVACALLHTSNITFKIATGEGSELIQSQSLVAALELLGVSQEALNDALCLCAIEARGEVFHKNLSVIQAGKALEALIKATYGALFTHIVRTINKSIAVNLEATSPHARGLPRIGVLDIFGFESFDVNSYEQLCINYCNEALQQQFNKFVFKLEQREYEQEGIDWSFIEFPDNQDILELIENKREGILSILDENCRLASCTDTTFCRAIYEKCKNHPRFSATQSQKADFEFSIEHYAGTVTYDSANFLEKNKDELPKETTELLASSSVRFLAYLGETLNIEDEPTSASAKSFASRDGTSGANNRRRNNSSILRTTVGSQFSQQLRELRDRIDSTSPHYVRCLKPNDDLVPNQFETHVIAEQLRCAGVLEAIRVSRVGFPHRYYHEQFIIRYGILLTKKTMRKKRGKDLCTSLINALIPQVSTVLNKQGSSTCVVSLGMQTGHRKVFLRTTVFDALELLRNKKMGLSAIIIQKNIRRFVAQHRYYVCLMAAIMIQRFLRQVNVYRQARIIKECDSAIRIQCVWRRFFAETELMASRLIAHFCQAYWRGIIARKLYVIMAMENQATMVQRYWRGYRVKLEYLRVLKTIVSIQCCWRCKVAKTVFKGLRREARSIGAIAAERDRFKEESLRLRKEVDSLRMSKQQKADCNEYDEVERLRREVARLQSVVTHTQGSLTKANSVPGDDDTRSFKSQTTKSWFGNAFGNERVDIHGSPSLPRSISATYRSPLTRNGSNRDGTPELLTMRSSVKSTISSPSTSLLDTDPHQDIVDYQLRNLSDSISSPSRIFHMSSSILGDGDNNNDERHHRMNQEPKDEKSKILTLHNSIKESDERLMNEIISQSKDHIFLVNAPNLDGRSALHVAVESNNLRAIRDLLEKNAAANAQDDYGNTPLHLSTGMDVAKLLLEEGSANPNIPNIDGICALHKTVEKLDVGSVRLLLKYYAKVDVADNINWFTPLHMALLPSDEIDTIDRKTVQVSRAMIVDLLCGDLSELDMNDQDREGNTPLHYAAQLETPDATEIISTILEKGADPNIRNCRNQQPLLLLMHNQDLRQIYDAFQECIHTLLYYGADPNHQSNTGCTPLHLSLHHNDIDSAIQLIDRSAELHLLWKRVSYCNDLVLFI
ncbi:MAG: myosin-5 [Bacillariaceae sp.]|jgi:myosin-5